MKAEITNRTDTTVTFTITVTVDELKHAKEHAYDKYRPQVKAAGFRPGKAPDTIVAREAGENSIQAEALDHAISHSYSDAIVSEKLAVIASPDIKVTKFVPYTELEFEATVEVVPPVKLVDYKKIKKAVKSVKVSDKQIDEVVEDLRRRVAKRVPALRAAKMEDEVKFDFNGVKKGEPVPGASGKNYTLKLGSKTFIPGFEEEMVGMKVGDVKTFTITFPKDYHEKTLANEAVEFTVTMNEVTELELPKVDDAFAAEVGPFKTVEELRTDVTGQLTSEAERANEREYEDELLEELINKSSMKVPERLAAQQVERMKAEMEQRLAGSGLTMEQYLTAQKQTQEEMEAMIKPEAEKRVKLAMMLSEIAKAEGLSVTSEEIENQIEILRMQYTDPAMQKELAGEQIKEDVFNHLMSTKTIQKLIEYAKN